MAWVWSAHGALGVVAALVCWAMAAVVYAAAPARTQARVTALLLVVMGADVGSLFGLAQLVTAPDVVSGLSGLNAAAIVVSPWVYLALLGTLDSPLARPLRGAWTRRALLAVPAAALLSWPWLAAALAPGQGGVPLFDVALVFHALVMMYALVVALSAWRRAPPEGLRRAQARAFLLSFGVRDVAMALLIVTYASGALDGATSLATRLWVAPASVLASALLLAYGILKEHLFDIDLRVKLTLRRSAVAGAFAAIFFVVSEALEQVVPVEGALPNILAAAALALVLRPVERFASALADRALPTADDAGYLDAQREGVYRAAFESAFETGGIDARERAMLERHREKLGLAPEAAARIEREVVAAASPPAPATAGQAPSTG